MTFHVEMGATSKTVLGEEVLKALNATLAHQPGHAHDREAIVASTVLMIDAMPEPQPGKEIWCRSTGSSGYTSPSGAGVIPVSSNVSITVYYK